MRDINKINKFKVYKQGRVNIDVLLDNLDLHKY